MPHYRLVVGSYHALNNANPVGSGEHGLLEHCRGKSLGHPLPGDGEDDGNDLCRLREDLDGDPYRCEQDLRDSHIRSGYRRSCSTLPCQCTSLYRADWLPSRKLVTPSAAPRMLQARAGSPRALRRSPPRRTHSSSWSCGRTSGSRTRRRRARVPQRDC